MSEFPGLAAEDAPRGPAGHAVPLCAHDAEIHRLLLAALPRMRLYASRLTGSATDADDLVQDMALRVLVAQDQFTLGTNFAAWCYTILHNLFISTKRHGARQTPAGEDDLALPSDGTQELSLYTQQVVFAVSHLPIKLRSALTLRAGGESYSEIAVGMNIGVATVKSRVARARIAIRHALTDVGDVPVPASNAAGCTWNFPAGGTGRRSGGLSPHGV